MTEPVGGRLSYKPPIYDINAPGLYIPFMSFRTYLVLAGFSLGLLGKFSPEALSLWFTKGLLGWFLEGVLLKVLLYSLGSGEAPLLDIAYGGKLRVFLYIAPDSSKTSEAWIPPLDFFPSLFSTASLSLPDANTCSISARSPSSITAMYDNLGASQPGMQRPPLNPQPMPFQDAFYGAGSGLIRGGLGAYGEKIFGSSSEYVQSNISRYFSDPQYYFQVNDQYVRNKLKVVLLPFLHRGHWTRITEPVGGRLSYKPPIYDINAPDLYIPFMSFGTYLVLAGFSLGLLGKFSPEALSLWFTKGLLGWFLEGVLLKVLLYSLGSGEAPLLDIIAYGGYAFTGLSLAVLAGIFSKYAYYIVLPWMCFCMGVFLVKTLKRVLFAEVRSYEKHSSRHHYLLLFMAVAQFPLFFWLGNIGS